MLPVRASKDGILLSIEDLSDKVCRLLESTLSYQRMVFNFGGGGRNAQPIDCYKYVIDPDGCFPRRMIVSAGYASRIGKVLKRSGYRLMIKNLRPEAAGLFEPNWSRLSDIEWKWRQKEVIEKLLKVPYGQVKVSPAYGKSFIIYALCRLLPRIRIAITTPSVSVIESLHAELSRSLPSVGLVTGSSKIGGHRITCYAGKSLHYCDKPVHLLLVDEGHEFGTDDYLRKLSSPAFRFARRWSFSANVDDRADQAGFELEGALGPVVIDIPYDDCVQHKCVVPISVRWRDVVMDHDPTDSCTTSVARQRYGIWRNKVRNEQIAEDARAHPNEQVLITVSTLEHAMYLKKELPEFTLCYSENGLSASERKKYINRGLIKSNEPVMTRDRRRLLRERFELGKLKKVIATGVWNRGVNFRQLAVLIRADATSSKIADTQIPGRTSRLCDETGKEIGVLYDYRDQFSKTFRNRAYTRRSHYKEHGWTQTDIRTKGLETRLRQKSLAGFKNSL